MTPQETIKKVKAIIMAEIDRLPHHYDAEVDDDVYDDTSRVNEILELNKIVSKALEKQIPKKLIKYDIDYSGNPLFRCPVCGDSWNSNEFGDGIEYCWTCGQALDWSNADDN